VLGGVVGWFSHLALLEATTSGAAGASLSFMRTVTHDETQTLESIFSGRDLFQCRRLEVKVVMSCCRLSAPKLDIF
jgi:hypothetical protein